jgi:hypothetical protein
MTQTVTSRIIHADSLMYEFVYVYLGLIYIFFKARKFL